MISRRLVAGTVLLVCSSSVAAEQASSDRVLMTLTGCREVATPSARLECFEKSTNALESAVRAKDVTILDRQDIRNARRSLFGFTLPRFGLFGRGDREHEPSENNDFEELTTTVSSVRLAANGRVELRLADGDAVWATTDPMPFPPKPGAKVRIRKGAIGNYFIAVEGLRTVRGMRLR
jgi:hypothetical protein